jgi:hypothetical protein
LKEQIMTSPKHAEAGSTFPPQDDAVSKKEPPTAPYVPDTSEHSRKRRSPTELHDSDEEDQSPKKRCLSPGKKSIPPKKLNVDNEKWDQMFQRLVEYEKKHGVRFATLHTDFVMPLLSQQALLSAYSTA